MGGFLHLQNNRGIPSRVILLSLLHIPELGTGDGMTWRAAASFHGPLFLRLTLF